jgi:1-deoxy-D-xylulose-5-phosphate reductoisomerase
MQKRISLLGSTGSIGKSTLDVVNHHPERFQVVALAAGNNAELLLEQALKFKPELVSVARKDAANWLRDRLPASMRVVSGDEGNIEAASHPNADVVVTAMLGSRGLEPTLAAIGARKTIALANKETLVTAGHLVTKAAQEAGVKLLPVDSEHSAIFQCLNGEKRTEVKRLILTSSGGSFRDRNREELHGVTVEEALKHPNWSMGAKITIDSATMMNKGLEVIEAHWLFDMPYDEIDVLIHPESIIHSMVEFRDGSILAQLGLPDMKLPIQYALTYPERWESPAPKMDFHQWSALHFKPMDLDRFPMLRMAFECGKSGGTYPTVLNAANEIAVDHFLHKKISFLDIEAVVASVLDRHESISLPSLAEIQAADHWAREAAGRIGTQ